MKVFRCFFLGAIFFITSCVYFKKNNNKLAPPEENFVKIHMFDDDEMILDLEHPPAFSIENQKVSNGLSVNSYRVLVELALSQLFYIALEKQYVASTEQEKLGLIARFQIPRLPTKLEMKIASLKIQKPFIGIGEAALNLKRVISTFAKGKGLNFKGVYFKDAVNEKWNDPNYSKFDQMSEVKNDKGQNIGGSNVYLGMAPNKDIFNLLRTTIVKKESLNEMEIGNVGAENSLKNYAEDLESIEVALKEFEVISLMEEFELSYTLNNLLKVEGDGLGVASIHKSNGKYEPMLVENLSSDLNERFSVFKWNEYSTPDRTMMTSTVLDNASKNLLDSMMRNERLVYVHCKSGKGRSATVVATARVKLLMKDAKNFSPAQIDKWIDQEISAVHQSRNDIKVSYAQKLNMKITLYEYAKKEF